MTGEVLSWKDPEDRVANIVSEVADCYSRSLHTDCVLLGGGERIRCHSVLLASVSPMFRDVLPQPDAMEEDVIVILPEWEEGEVEIALRLLYCGMVSCKAGASLESKEQVRKVASIMKCFGVTSFSEENCTLTATEVEELDRIQVKERLNELKILSVASVLKDEFKNNKNRQLNEDILVGNYNESDWQNQSLNTHSLNNIEERIQCFRCAGDQESLELYVVHLLDHQTETKKCIKRFSEKLWGKEEEEDWMCESCYINILSESEKTNLGKEAYDALKRHKESCRAEVQTEIERVNELVKKRSKDDNNGHLLSDKPVCSRCKMQFKLKIELKQHLKTCSNMIREASEDCDSPSSLLKLLSSNNWTKCPLCYDNMDAARMPLHLIYHDEIISLIDKEVPNQEEYKCPNISCHKKYSSEDRIHFIVHVYVNCALSAKANLESLLAKFTLGDVNVLGENILVEKKRMNNEVINDVLSNGSGGSPVPPVDKLSSKVRNRTRSGKSASGDEGFRSCRSDNTLENIPSNLKCKQCLRVFDTQERYKSIKKHFCMKVGKLSEPLRELMNPTPTKLVTDKCSICVGGPVLASEYQLKKHLALAHKASFFIKELRQQNYEDDKFPIGCHLCKKTDIKCWEDAIVHIGIDHEKLYQALKHDPSNDYKVLLKRLFKEKFERKNKKDNSKNNHSVENHSDVEVPSVQNEKLNNVKRKIDIENKSQEGNFAKRKKIEGITADSEAWETNGDKKFKGKTKSADTKPYFICDICPSLRTYAKLRGLSDHQADAHFSDYILTNYPLPGGSLPREYPCGFPSCNAILSTKSARVKHLGWTHQQVKLCLATTKIIEQAKEAAKHGRTSGSSRQKFVSSEKDKVLNLGCNLSFPARDVSQVHTCHSPIEKSDKIGTGPRNVPEQEYERPVVPSVLPQSETTPLSVPSAPQSDGCANLPTGLEVQSNSENEQFNTELNTEQIRMKINSVCTSSSDSDIETDHKEPSSGVVVQTVERSKETVTPESCTFLCKACSGKFANASDLELHYQCSRCSPGKLSVMHRTCESHITCIYCSKCYKKGVEVHVTCDGRKCKKCFSSKEEMNKHFKENHSWEDT